MGRSPQQFEVAYAIKKAALGPHVVPRWGWDEAGQRAILEEKWRAKHFFAILVDGNTVGTVAIDEHGGALHLSEFYIVPEQQGHGIGSAVLEPILRDADARGLSVNLHVLKWNPAVALYERHGFRVVREDDVHYFMERAAAR